MIGKHTNLILLGMAAGVVLGVLLGLVAPDTMLALGFIGKLFLNALRLLIVPIAAASIIVGVTNLGNLPRFGRSIWTALGYFLATTGIAVILGLVLSFVMQPGRGIDPTLGQFLPGMSGAPTHSIGDFLASLVPENLFRAISDGQYIGLIVFMLVVGGVLVTLGGPLRTITTFFRELHEVLLKIITGLLYAAPVGLLFVISSIVAQNRDSLGNLLGGLWWFGLTALIGLIIYGVVILPLILRLFTRQNALEYASNVMPALFTAFGTASSSATLPITYENTVTGNKVDQRASSVMLPLGSAMSMDGSALYITIAAIFIAQVFGVQLSFFQVLMVAVGSFLVSLTAPGMPSASFFMLAVVLGVADYPPEAYAGLGLILGLDWLFDRFRTVVNVWSDTIGAAVVAEQLATPIVGTGKTPPRPAGRTGDRYERRDRGGDRDRRPDDRRGMRTGDRPPREAREHREPREGRDGRDRGPRRPERVSAEHPANSPFAVRAQGDPAFVVEAPETPRPSDEPPRPDERPARAEGGDRGPRPRRDREPREPRGERPTERGDRPERSERRGRDNREGRDSRGGRDRGRRPRFGDRPERTERPEPIAAEGPDESETIRPRPLGVAEEPMRPQAEAQAVPTSSGEEATFRYTDMPVIERRPIGDEQREPEQRPELPESAYRPEPSHAPSSEEHRDADQPVVSYGHRNRHKRVFRPEDEGAETESNPPTPAAPPAEGNTSEDSQPIAFGRNRRKRMQ